MCSSGDGHRRRESRSVVDHQRGDHGGGRQRQRAGNAEEGVPVQNTRDATGGRTVDAGERHERRRGRGDLRNRRATGQEAVDVIRAQRHRGTVFVQGKYLSARCDQTLTKSSRKRNYQKFYALSLSR